MKAMICFTGSMLLFASGTANAESPGFLADPLQLVAEDGATPKPAPLYTPIPAWRKAPATASPPAQPNLGPSNRATPNGSVSNAVSSPDGKSSATAGQPALPSVSPYAVKSTFVANPAQSEFGAFNDSFPVSSATTSGDIPTPAIISPTLPPVSPQPAFAPMIVPSGPSIAPSGPTIVGPPEPSYAYRPLLPVVKSPRSVHLGRGVLGQPTVYVPGQPVRNFLRYLSP